MNLLNPEEIKLLDKKTIEVQKISSEDLMERAATACYLKIREHLTFLEHFSATIHVFCGAGNNGGDGYVLARLFSENNFKVITYDVFPSVQKSEDNQSNYNKLKKSSATIVSCENESSIKQIPESDLIIDAIFGIGLNKKVDGFAKEIINSINKSSAVTISIDIPSGLFAEDNTENDFSAIVMSDYTFTFQSPKFSFMFAENAKYIGEYFIVDIGLENPDSIIKSKPRILLTKKFVALQLKKRAKFSHKGTYGHALIVSGQKGKMGAAVLCSSACIKSGAGLVTAYVPSCGIDIMQISIPEIMVESSATENYISGAPNLEKYNSIAIGPGIGLEKETANTVKKIIQDANSPLVIDADALNLISENKTWLAFLPAGTILTPHPKEFDRLFGKSETSYERIQKQIEASIKNGIYIVLKGAHSSIACPDGTLYFNSTGNPGMASAGMGDVLTGIIAGFLACGYHSATAAVLATYLHGLSADNSLINESFESLTASDVVKNLGISIQELSN